MTALILASSSPRRRELLEAAGASFIVVEPDAEEECGGIVSLTAQRNASSKADSVAVRHTDAIVIGADTVVALGGECIGKPRDSSDARRMLSSLSGTRHRVVTGVAVLSRSRRAVSSAETVVRFRELSAAEIDSYIASGEWAGKAGAYAVQEGARGFVESLDGSYSNVVGLPLELLASMLVQFGVDTGGWRMPAWR